MATETNNNVGNEGGNDPSVQAGIESISLSTIFAPGAQAPQTGTKVEPTAPLATEPDTSKDDSKDDENTGGEGVGNEVEEYTQDGEGNLLDAAGKVVAKKDEYKVDEDGNISFTGKTEGEETGLEPVYEIAKAKGYNLNDKDGNPITFENTPEGIVQFAETVGEQKVDEYENKLLTAYPIIEDIVGHLQAGGKLTDFFESKVGSVDYTKTTFSGDNVAQHRDLVKSYLTKVAKLPEDDADDTIKLYEDGGKLEEKAKVALERLKHNQVETEKAKRAADQAEIKRQQLATEQYWNNTKEVIKTGKLGDLQIPDGDKDGFFNFIALKDKEGKSGRVKKYAALSQSEQLKLDYLLYKDLSLDDLVKLKVKETQAANLRNRKAVLKASKGAKLVSKTTDPMTNDFSIGNLI